MKILWLLTAEGDLDALTDYIAYDNPQSAFHIFETIQISVENLATYPLAGRQGRVAQTRELVIPHLSYIVVYTIAEEILILAVFHTSRKWPTAFKRP